MTLMNPCPPVAWNVVQAAESLSSLAGLIAGFMLTGLIVLLVERRRHFHPMLVPGLTLFFSGFISLGLNAYVFALVSGEAPGACRRIWTAAAVSSGMLATGVIAAVGGVTLLIHAYLAALTDRAEDAEQENAAYQFGLLRRLLRGAFILCTAMVISLVMGRHVEALWVWAKDDVVQGFPALVVGAVVIAASLLAVTLFRQRRTGHADPCRRLYAGATIAVTQAIVGTVLLGSLLSLTRGNWESQGPWWGWVIAAEALVPLAAITLFAMGVTRLIKR